MSLNFNEQGLIPAVAQERLTGQVRMVAWMNREALQKTLETGQATFFSRSRGKLWTKGETSGHTLRVASVTADCDADTLLLLVDSAGPSCHTGRPSCFFQRVDADGHLTELANEAEPFLSELERTIRAREASTAEKSYTRSLLDGGVPKIGAKITEEAGELVSALASESNERVASEAADLLFHLLVGLRARGVELPELLAAMSARTGQSGHAEKAARQAPR
ncbi:MAG TPA: bifunctional phosphoribosyl-AMP cyclohydrolase/phosphoribosyl-ATP diphosphatase HisIE [Polyangiaceae bacterium]|jgi:phosphoribosyl-ATP pyrophosphohydrolase/phosphoribosyl-AMP cyclohydrolase